MFGNFKRDNAVIAALTKIVKEGIHPALQVLFVTEDTWDQRSASYVVCMEGLKNKEDLFNFFAIPIDPTCPDIVAYLKEKFSNSAGEFMFKGLLDAVFAIGPVWRAALKSKVKFKVYTSGILAEPYSLRSEKKYGGSSKSVSFTVEVSAPLAIMRKKEFLVSITAPDDKKDCVLKIQQRTCQSSDIGTVYYRDAAEGFQAYVDEMNEMLVSQLELCKKVAGDVLAMPLDKMADVLLAKPTILSAFRQKLKV